MQHLGTAGTDAKSRQALLKASCWSIEQLAQEASTAGVETRIITRLEACVQALRQLLGEAQPPDDAVHAVWEEVVAALTEYQAATNAAPTDRREEFWA